MKSFVREREDEVRIALGVFLAGIILIGGELVGELAYLPLILAVTVQLLWEFRRWRRERAKERSGGARSTGSR
jgi:hypothetical protein